MTGAYHDRPVESVRLPQGLRETLFDYEVIVEWKIYRSKVIEEGRYIKAWVAHVELISITCQAKRTLSYFEYELQLPSL
eukprot:12913437-Prorocentrum_lima.AAC.1